MTILVSNPSTDFIIMLSDSAITDEHLQEDGTSFQTYDRGSKTIPYDGVGCITTWGDQTGNRLRTYLQRYNIYQTKPRISELAGYVKQYLEREYPKSPDQELGFHVAGFEDGKPKLYHVFWGFNRPKQSGETNKSVHSPDHSDEFLVYNGRNDLAEELINTLIDEIRSGQEIRFDPSTPIGRITLCDFIARFASEITPQVGPPFDMRLIFPDNSIEKIENMSLSPISLESACAVLPKLFQQARSADKEAQNWDYYKGSLGAESADFPNGNVPPYSGGTVIYSGKDSTRR